MFHKSYPLAGWLIVLVSFGVTGLKAQNGPTPFPAQEDTSAWPGKGVIRVFPWMTDNRNYFWAQRAEAQNAVVFVGDSLTGNWTDLPVAFAKLHLANRGIGGEVTRGLLFRLKEDALNLHPKALVILSGANDLSAKEAPADALANLAEIIELARAQSVTMPIILCTLPPRDSSEAPVDAGQLAEMNKGIKALATAKPNVVLLDLHTSLLSPGGSPDWSNFAADKLHLGPTGYAKWHDLLEPVFKRLKLM